MALIEIARRNLQEQKTGSQTQEAANQLFTQMFDTCNDIVEQYGKKMGDNQLRDIPVEKLLTGNQFLTTLLEKKVLVTEFNDNEQSIKVALISSKDPEREQINYVCIAIEGLNQFLQVFNNLGVIKGEVPYSSRRANMIDANNWGEIVDLIKQKYLSSSQQEK